MNRFSFGTALRWGAVMSAAALGLGASSCVRGPSGPDEGPIRIACILPLTGELEGESREWLKGTRQAVAEINAAGGPLPGRLVELREYDSRTVPATSAMLARQAIDDGAVAIIGDGFSGGALAVFRDVTSAAHIPTGSCCATSADLTAAVRSAPTDGRYFFRASPSDDRQAIVVSDVVIDGPNATNPGDVLFCRNVVILHVDTTYGTPFANSVRAEIMRRESSINVTLVPFPPAESAADFSAQVNALTMARPDCAVAIGYARAIGAIVRGYRNNMSAGPITFIGTDGVYAPALITESSTAALADARITFLGTAPLSRYADLSMATSNYRTFAEDFRAAYGEYPPVPYVSSSYDVTALLLLGIASAGSTDGAEVMAGVRAVSGPGGRTVFPGGLAEALRTLSSGPINYDGASGPVDVNADGDVDGPFEIWRVNRAGTDLEFVRRFEAGEFPR